MGKSSGDFTALTTNHLKAMALALQMGYTQPGVACGAQYARQACGNCNGGSQTCKDGSWGPCEHVPAMHTYTQTSTATASAGTMIPKRPWRRALLQPGTLPNPATVATPRTAKTPIRNEVDERVQCAQRMR